MSDYEINQINKSHNRKKEKFKKKLKKTEKNNEDAKLDLNQKDDFEKAKAKNPRAFAINSFVAAERQFRRTQDINEKRTQLPEVDRSSLEPPPIVVAIVGPPSVGKSTLMQNLIKNYTRQKLNHIKGPVTIVTGKSRRLTLIECNNDLNSMIDVAKVADLVLLMIDASFGFEMETFEFLNICQVHGMPRIMGILTHMDLLSNNKQLKKIKKKLKHRFWTEIYQGAKLFYLTGIVNNEYRKHEIHNLARFISVMKFKDIGYKTNHSFLIADRIEDITQPDIIRQNDKCNRNICFYGYVRGSNLKKSSNVHIPGSGDYQISDISYLSDPCSLPNQEKKRTLDDRERLLYAPFSGVGGLVYDKDAVYIELGGSHSYNSSFDNQKYPSINKKYFDNIISSKKTLDFKLIESRLKIFSAETSTNDILHNNIQENISYIKDDLNQEIIKNQNSSTDSDGLHQSESDRSDFEEVKWKENAIKNANKIFEKKKFINWNNLVYDNENNNFEDQNNFNTNNNNDDFFKVKKYSTQKKEFDNSKYDNILKFQDIENNIEDIELIKDCFVTGKWEKRKDASHLLDEESYQGDFENLEDSKIKYKNEDYEDDDDDDSYNDDDESYNDDDDDEGNDHDNDDDQSDEISKKIVKIKKRTKNEMTKRERLLNKKKRLKEKFNTQFDSKTLDESAEKSDTYFESLNEKASKQSILNRLEFEKMENSTRIEYEGFKSGMYVRVEIKGIPCEFIKNFDAKYLTILGSLLTNESNVGIVQVRMKKHRWHNKILRTKNPLIISLGWRRFQTIPIYFIQDHNMRNRYLKYTPQHMYCHASFWGPVTPPNTGFLAVQSLENNTKNFRISATGVVTNSNRSIQIVKKLKLIGTPLKIFRKTAFIQGMFSTVLEASKFEGASIKTVSGIRGQVKKALHSSSIPPGSIRATFEDKILASDTVFLRSWFAVNVPKFYTPITNLLELDKSKTLVENSVKTIADLKKEKELQVVPNINSLYQPIIREEKVFKPLKIHRHIEEQLPFKFKTKIEIVPKNLINDQRIAIIKEQKDSKITEAMNMLKKVYQNRVNKKNIAHVEKIKKFKKESEKKEAKKLEKNKVIKKQIYRRLGKQEKRKSKYSE